jgi:hypothetical protein
MGVGLTTLPCKKENCWEASKKFSRILWRRPRPKLGRGAKERRRRETGCENGRLMKVAQDRVQWRALVLAVLKLGFLLSESRMIQFIVAAADLQNKSHPVVLSLCKLKLLIANSEYLLCINFVS